MNEPAVRATVAAYSEAAQWLTAFGAIALASGLVAVGLTLLLISLYLVLKIEQFMRGIC